MCVFCKIINNEIPSYRVYEDEYCIAILDISQATIGHTLVMPKKHFKNILELDDETAKHLFKVTKDLSIKISKLPNVLGLNVLNNCGEKAGQSVDHFHIHIIPRYDSDKVLFSFPQNKLSNEEFLKLLESIKK